MSRKGYVPEQMKEAEAMILATFRDMCQYDYAKLTVNMSRIKGKIIIVPEPRIEVEGKKSP